MHISPLDESVFTTQAALQERSLAAPTALIFSATGLDVLPSRLKGAQQIPFSQLAGTPACCRELVLHYGEFNGVPVWMVEDETPPTDEPAWARAFPVWLAAAAGATTMLYTTAGHGLTDEHGVGSLALVRDHINLSGENVLTGLGPSRLGPLFPDVSSLHDEPLREAALSVCTELGVAAFSAVAACTGGPAIDTPSERAYFARAGADVAVQRLAAPLIAAAHAGLGVLATVAVTHTGDGPIDVGRVAATSAAVAPVVDDLVWTLAERVQRDAHSGLDSAAQ